MKLPKLALPTASRCLLTLLLKSATRATTGSAGSIDVRSRAFDQKDLLERLRFWQQAREARIAKIFHWATTSQSAARMSVADRQKFEATQQHKIDTASTARPQADDMAWLYTPAIEKEVEAWQESRP